MEYSVLEKLNEDNKITKEIGETYQKVLANTYIYYYYYKFHKDLAEIFLKEINGKIIDDFNLIQLNKLIESKNFEEGINICTAQTLKYEKKQDKKTICHKFFTDQLFFENSNEQRVKYLKSIKMMIIYIKLLAYFENFKTNYNMLDYFKTIFTEEEKLIILKEIPSITQSWSSSQDTKLRTLEVLNSKIKDFNNDNLSDFYKWHDYSLENSFLSTYYNQYMHKNHIFLSKYQENSILNSIKENKKNELINLTRKELFLFDNIKRNKISTIPSNFCTTIGEKYSHEISEIILSNTKIYIAIVLKNETYKIYSIEHSIEKEKTSFKYLYTFKEHSEQLNTLKFSPNDYYCISTTIKELTIKVSIAKTGKLIQNITSGHSDKITCANWVGNSGKIFISSGLDKKLFIWSRTSNIDINIKQDEYPIENFKFTKIKQLDTENITEIHYSNAFSILVFIAPTKNCLHFYSAISLKFLHEYKLEDAIVNCSINSIGDKLIVNNSKTWPVIILLELNYQSEEFTVVQKRKYFGHRQESFSIKCNFGGNYDEFVLCGSEDAYIYVWSILESLPKLKIKIHSSPVNCVVWTHDLLISCSDDHTVKVLNSNESKFKIVVK